MKHIEYVTEIIMKTARVYVVVRKIRLQFIIERLMKSQREEIVHVQRTLRNDDEANKSHDVVCDFDVIET